MMTDVDIESMYFQVRSYSLFLILLGAQINMATAAVETKNSSDVGQKVTVAVRYRPLSPDELAKEEISIVTSDDTSIELQDPSSEEKKKFTFDHVYSDKVSQTKVQGGA